MKPVDQELVNEAISADSKIDLQKIMAMYKKTRPSDVKGAASRDRELEVYKMRYVNDMTLAQVAKELNISAARVKQIESKALSRFKKITDRLKEEAPATSITNNSVDTSPGVKQTVLTDKRYSAKKPPVYLKKFRKFIEK